MIKNPADIDWGDMGIDLVIECNTMSSQCEVSANKTAGAQMGVFERYLSLWVFICIVIGVSLGHLSGAFISISISLFR